ncbi:MAG: ankyrin repeat domain-containing protein, partial [Thermodesulfobacteriota bacterium]
MPIKHARIARITPVTLAIALVLALAPHIVSATDKNEALIHAASKGDLAEVARLLNSGADANGLGFFDLPLLIEAADIGNVEVMQLLLEKGANVNVKDDEGLTPLMTAVMDGHPEATSIQKIFGIDMSTRPPKDHAQLVKLL